MGCEQEQVCIQVGCNVNAHKDNMFTFNNLSVPPTGQ